MALEGKLCLLREVRDSDLQFLIDLRNNLNTQGFTKTLPTDYTMPMYRKTFEAQEFSFTRNAASFIIEDKKTHQAAGSLRYYEHKPRLSVVLGIAVAENFWGTGIAFDAQETILNFFFEELGLRVVTLYTNSGNLSAVGLAKKSGFKTAVRQRESVWRRGQFFDNLVMDLLREEYYQLHPEFIDNLPPI